MRWKRLLRIALLAAVLLLPTTALYAARAAAPPSPWRIAVVDWLETAWAHFVLFAASEEPPGTAPAGEGGPEGDPNGSDATQIDGDGTPSAEGGPEWDPDGST